MVGFQPDTGNLLKSETVDGSTRNPANSPVEVKVVKHPIIYKVSEVSQVVGLGISERSTVAPEH